MAEATIAYDSDVLEVTTPAAGYASGEVIQLADGRAAFVTGLLARASGEVAGLKTTGQVTLAKTAAVVILKGAPLYWDRSAGTVTPLKAVAGADFFVGVAVADAISAATTVVVDLNVQPQYTIDVMRDPADTVLVGTADKAELMMGPGYAKLALEATAEAQKVDVLSKHSVPVTVPFIVEGRMAIYDIGAAAADINIGVANATHASDCDSITESLFLHLDGAVLDILAECDGGAEEGAIEVAATDTLVDAVDDTYFDFAFDCRDLEDIKIYIDGVRVLSLTTFALDVAVGPLCLLAHIEKTSDASTGEIRVEKLALRGTDLAA